MHRKTIISQLFNIFNIVIEDAFEGILNKAYINTSICEFEISKRSCEMAKYKRHRAATYQIPKKIE